ncbi:hypothetical protein FD755_015486 [Muntiacus reevesi]|uniref:ABC transmembrane type-1 domain-containing protein n=1 Tax=Muntiacus reevesi TaxID=9886 RepID=A0A5N3XG75_MUNRE|nr:hypothetical protein FD755_015486 [Muntiacus reevesi]
MALPPTCVAPCSVLPSLGVGVGGRPHGFRPGHSSAVAEARSGRPGERAGPDGQLALHSRRRRWFSVRAKQTGEAARSPTSLSGPTGTAAETARTATTRTAASASKMLPVFPEGKPNPLQHANLCSRLVFCIVHTLFYLFIFIFWPCYMAYGIIEIFRVLLPTYFEGLLTYFQNYDPSDSGTLFKAYGYTAVLECLPCHLGNSAALFLILCSAYRNEIKSSHVPCDLPQGKCHLVQKFTLRLSNSAIGKTTTGQIINLLSNDVNRFDRVTILLHILWIGPLTAITVIILLWMVIGISSLAGMALLIIFMLLQTFSGKSFLSLRSKTAAFTDTRLRTMNEVITGIRTIKMYAWEKSFAELITRLRRKEISKILRSSYLDGMNLIFFDTSSKVILFVTFTTYVLLGNMITVKQVFLAITLYQVVKFTGILLFPLAIESVAETVASVRRIKVW